MILLAKRLWSKIKSWVAVGGAVVLLLAVTNGFTYLRTDAAAYARGVRDQKIKTLGSTEILNAALDVARNKAAAAALDAEIRRRQLTELERELADERANDPLAGGDGLPISELQRIFRVD